jgi:transposase InsO family protein
VELISSRTGQGFGKPWLTMLIDAFSRRILSLFLTYDPPSYRSCMMVLRECVRRHERLPQILVVDGGAEFRSVYLDTLLARYESRVVKIFKCVEESQSSMMDVEDEHYRMGAAFGLRYRIG